MKVEFEACTDLPLLPKTMEAINAERGANATAHPTNDFARRPYPLWVAIAEIHEVLAEIKDQLRQAAPQASVTQSRTINLASGEFSVRDCLTELHKKVDSLRETKTPKSRR